MKMVKCCMRRQIYGFFILTLLSASNVQVADATSILDFLYDAIFAVLRIPRSPAGRLSEVWPLSIFLGTDYQRIYSGLMVDSREDYSYVARLDVWHLGRLGPLLCGGAIIHPKWILTAARCLMDEETGILARTIDVTVGDLDARIVEGTEQYRNGTPFIHPSYDRQTFDYDIGLVKLNASLVGVLLPQSPNAPPSTASTTVSTSRSFSLLAATTRAKTVHPVSVITIPRGEELDSTSGNTVEISGWGQVVHSGAPFMPVGLRSALMQVYSTERCQNDWFVVPIKDSTPDRIPQISERSLCLVGRVRSDVSNLSEDGAGFCTGDIGGPVIATKRGKKYLIGVMSFTKVAHLERKGLPLPMDTCSMKYPNVATKVRTLVESFIQPTIYDNP